MLRFSIFGTLLSVERTGSGWIPFFLGQDGKRRRAEFEIPAFVTEEELCQYLADLLHESATPANPDAYELE
jgi:hypothetical protein